MQTSWRNQGLKKPDLPKCRLADLDIQFVQRMVQERMRSGHGRREDIFVAPGVFHLHFAAGSDMPVGQKKVGSTVLGKPASIRSTAG